MLRRIPVKERVAAIMLLAVILTNPLTSQFVLQGILYVFDELIKYGAWVTMVAASYVMALLAWRWFQSEQPKIPKAKKTKSQTYLET